MTKQDLLNTLEYWAESLDNPAYNYLEVGFRHTSLNKDEVLKRYKDSCDITRNNILQVMEIIEKEGVEQ